MLAAGASANTIDDQLYNSTAADRYKDQCRSALAALQKRSSNHYPHLNELVLYDYDRFVIVSVTFTHSRRHIYHEQNRDTRNVSKLFRLHL